MQANENRLSSNDGMVRYSKQSASTAMPPPSISLGSFTLPVLLLMCGRCSRIYPATPITRTANTSTALPCLTPDSAIPSAFTHSVASGRAYLEETLGIVCEWYYRPSDASARSYYHLKHALALTDFLVAAQVYSNSQQEIELETLRTQYELERTPAHITVTSRNKTETVKVVPDAWLDFTLQGEHSPILLEIDRATEEEKKFKAHVKARVEFIKPEGRYKQLFGTNAVTVAYATTGNENRLKHMINWTENVLTELDKQNYADSFRFCILPDDLSTTTLFASPSWYRPFESTPLPLFS